MEPNPTNEMAESAKLIGELWSKKPDFILLHNDLLRVKEFVEDKSGYYLALLTSDLDSMMIKVDELTYRHISIPEPIPVNGEKVEAKSPVQCVGYNDKHVRYLCDAMAIMSVYISPDVAELIITTHEKIKTMGGDFSLRDAAKIKVAVENKYRPKEKTDERFNELRPDYTPPAVKLEEAQ